MIIGIDAHNLEGKRTGVGRYLFNLLKEWDNISICHSERSEESIANASRHKVGDPSGCALRMTKGIKFILYFKDGIPENLPPRLCSGQAPFECELLKTKSTAKFIHWDLPRAAKKDKIDILFCPGYVAPVFYGGKIALTLHDISYEAHPEWFNWSSLADRILLKWISEKSAKKAAVIFTPSEFSRQEVIKYYGAPVEKIIATPLAVDSSLFEKFHSPAHQTKEIKVIKEKYGLKDEFVFYIGSIFSRRHLPEIIAAFKHLTKEMPEYQLLAVGKDYTSNRSVDKIIEKINQELGRPAILRIDYPSDSELKLLYSACAFFIWLSDYEGFGLPVLEAMSCGAPVITTDGSSLNEVAGQAALLIKNNYDIKEIYRAMKRLAEDEILRQELVKKGKEQASKFSWKECAEKTLEKLLIFN